MQKSGKKHCFSRSLRPWWNCSFAFDGFDACSCKFAGHNRIIYTFYAYILVGTRNQLMFNFVQCASLRKLQDVKLLFLRLLQVLMVAFARYLFTMLIYVFFEKVTP